MCIVHNTLRDATTPYTERYKQLKNTMKNILIILFIILSSFTSKAQIQIVNVWDGYYSFTPSAITIQLGDTVQWLPLGGGAPILPNL